jgi:cell division protein FtsL
MLGVGLFLCVLALLVIGLLFFIAWDACEYDQRIADLETTVKEQAGEIRTLQDKRDEPFAESYLKSEATS